MPSKSYRPQAKDKAWLWPLHTFTGAIPLAVLHHLGLVLGSHNSCSFPSSARFFDGSQRVFFQLTES